MEYIDNIRREGKLMSKESTKEIKDLVTDEEKQEINLVNEELLRSKIYEVRGQKVMLDVDLAEIYGYETKSFNRQVKNNKDKFEGDDFMFQVTKEELEEILRCKNCTLNKGEGQGKHVKYNPYVFTEQGIYMLMTVLRGELAIKQSRALIRTFKKMKDYILEHQNLIGQREYLILSMQVSENMLTTMELRSDLAEVQYKIADTLDKLGEYVTHSELSEMMPMFDEEEDKRGYLLLNAKPFWGDVVYDKIYSRARKSIYIVDNYIGIRTFEKLINIPKGVEVSIFSDNLGKFTNNTYLDFCKEYPDIHIKLYESGGIFHDRYIILDYNTSDEKIFLCGGSSKDAGGKISSILEDKDRRKYDGMIKDLLNNPELVLK